MAPLRREEEWARRLIALELGVLVQQHDDGSAPGVYDLDIVGDDGVAAAEVTFAADAETIEFWNLMNRGGRWRVDDLAGGWSVSAEPSARVKRLKADLPGFLRGLERDEVRLYRRGRGRRARDQLARELGVLRAYQGGTSFPGSVYVTPQIPIERMAGYAAANGDALAQWLGPFLTAPEQHDVLQKLGRSRCAQRHAFVIFPGFTPAPFEVVDILVRDHAPPAVDPDLPPEVTDVWAVSVWSTGTGFRWSPGTGWLPFAKDGATVPSGSGD